MTSYYWPIDNSRARATSISPLSSGLIIPVWSDAKSWYFDGSTIAVSSAYLVGSAYGIGNYGDGPYPDGPLASTCGFSSAVADTASGAWLVQWQGSLVHLTSGSIFTAYTLPIVGNETAYTGVTYNSTTSAAYTVNNNGDIYTQTGSGVSLIGSFFIGTGQVYGSGFYGSGFYSSIPLGAKSLWGLVTSGTTLFSFAPGALYAFPLSGAASGIGLPITAPIQNPTCIAAKPNYVAIGGWSQATIGSGGSGIVNLAFDLVNSNLLAMRPAAGRIDLYGGSSEVWTLTQSLSGMSNPTYGAWDGDGVGAIVTSPSSGVVYNILYSLGVLSIQNTTSGVPNASACTIQNDQITAFVCQPTQNQVMQLNLVGSHWVTGATFAITGASTIQTLTNTLSGVAVGYASGVAFLQGNAQNYHIANTVPLTYTPTAITIDAASNVVAVGTSGASGVFTPFTGVVSGASLTWPGNALGVVYLQGQVTVLDAINNVYRHYGKYDGVPYSLYNAEPFYTSGVSGIGLAVSPFTATASGGTTFTMTSGGSALAYMSHYVGPFNISPAVSGQVSIYSSGAWTTVGLNERDAPTAMTFDGSGNLQVATRNNLLYAIAASGTIQSTATIPVYTRQIQTTSLGISAMTYSLNHLWGVSSFNGALVELF